MSGLHLAHAKIRRTRDAMAGELQHTYRTAAGSGLFTGGTSSATIRLESRLRAIDYTLTVIADCIEVEATGLPA